MRKNNKKTMNERTHNSQEIYKNNRNSNSNNQTPGKSMNQEFATEFDTKKRSTNRSNEKKA